MFFLLGWNWGHEPGRFQSNCNGILKPRGHCLKLRYFGMGPDTVKGQNSLYSVICFPWGVPSSYWTGVDTGTSMSFFPNIYMHRYSGSLLRPPHLTPFTYSKTGLQCITWSQGPVHSSLLHLGKAWSSICTSLVTQWFHLPWAIPRGWNSNATKFVEASLVR